MALELGVNDFRAVLDDLASVFEENKAYLNELDAKIGDGDHGLSMARGFARVKRHADETAPESITGLLTEGGMQFNEEAGSTIGILMFSAMRAAGKAVAGGDSVGLEELAAMLEAAVEAISKRGKAHVGQKTILDSLHPALEALRAGLETGEVEADVVRRAVQAAADGVERTRGMKAGIGRAKWFAERTRGELDPGAVSGHLIVKAFGDRLLGG